MSEYQSFYITQAALLFRNDKCLIIEYQHGGEWGLPGGRINEGEVGVEALKREIREEIGIENVVVRGVVDAEVWLTTKHRNPKCDIVYLIDSVDPVELRANDEIKSLRWVNENEVDGLKFSWPHGQRFIHKGFEKIKSNNTII